MDACQAAEEARIPSKIVAFLETELLPDGGTLTVRTNDFRGQLLVKGASAQALKHLLAFMFQALLCKAASTNTL